MALPPQLSAAEREHALAVAKAARQERAQSKKMLHRGEITLADFLAVTADNSVLAKMRVMELLESLPGYGKIRAQSLMEKLEISPTRRVQGLGKHCLLYTSPSPRDCS